MTTRFAVTFFEDHAAQTKTEEALTLPALAELIRTTTAAEKARLRWLKLARFGNARTQKGSLRNDRNVIAVSGVEADYDAEKVAFGDAIEILEKAGAEAIVYTSPSRSEGRPRWRVVCPFSTELPPDRRQHMLGRLNGLFEGAFAGESWTLSQAYYFGSVDGNPAHRVEVVEGMAIDLCHELDKIWLGKPNTKGAQGNGNGQFQSGPVDEEALLEEITSGQSYHLSCIRLVGLWAQQGVAFLDAQQRLYAAFDAVDAAIRDARWQQRRGDIPRIVRDIYGADAEQRDAAAASRPGDATPPEFSDEGLALHFSDRHASDLRYVAAFGQWHIWMGSYWGADDTLQAFDLARAVCRSASALLFSSSKRKGPALAVAGARTVAAVERLARADRRHATHADQWDRDAWIFNTPIGGGQTDDDRPEDR